MSGEPHLDREGPDALHEQLTARLRADIQRLGPGARLPTEQELTSTYGISRTTVRSALQVLVDEGLLVRRQGRGTYVATPRLAHPLDQVWAFVETFTAGGLAPSSEVIGFGWVENQNELPTELGGPHSGALHVRRLYRVSDEPAALAEAYLPDPYGRSISRADVEEHPTFQVLQERLGVDVHRARVVVRSRAADNKVADALGLVPQSPLLVLHRWLYSADAALLQYAVYHLPADQFEFSLEPTLDQPHSVSYAFHTAVPTLTMSAHRRDVSGAQAGS